MSLSGGQGGAPRVLADALGEGLDPGLEPLEGAAALGRAGAVTVADRPRGGAALDRAATSWAVYEGGRDPYVILVTIYIFGPYFATAVVGDPVRGQALVANISMISGLIVALTGPLLGASIDQIGRRKPLLLAATAVMIPLLALLWWVKPHGGLGLGFASAVLGALGVAFAYSEILHNSLLTRAATPRQAPFASGLALSLGNLASLVMLAFVLWAFALPGRLHLPFVPERPLFGLNPEAHETDRIVGPICALALLLGAAPLFLFTPDAAPTGVPMARAFGEGARSLRRVLSTLRQDRPAAIFLGSRMLYTDGMTALLVFTGVFAAGVMGWRTLELLSYGICLSLFAVAGGQLGARLDAALGPRRAVQIEILGAALCLTASLGMGPHRILYAPYASTTRLWAGPVFTTAPQVVFLLIGCCSAVFVTAQYASSRTFLTRLAPAGRSASYFGLYALSGTVTMWLGSMLVRIFTGVFRTQQAGFAPIAILLVAGLVGMGFVRTDGREPADSSRGEDARLA